MMKGQGQTRAIPGRGFTLVELLVVIAVIALLMAILMPSLNKARQSAYAIKCAGNMRNAGVAMQSYTADTGTYPASYVYPDNDGGSFSLETQSEDHPYGYLHWSWYLFDSGRCDETAFTCPAMDGGGAPRANPGIRRRDWERGQVDQNGNTEPSSLTDKQASRMAYTANGAIVPRNKFTGPGFASLQRHNRLVQPSEIERPSEVILLTEFNRNWRSLAIAQGGGLLVKSHRPVTPFSHTSTGYQGLGIYNAGKDSPAFRYGDWTAPNYGLKSLTEVEQAQDLLDGGSGHPLNAVGRHHPGSTNWVSPTGEPMGGTTNFLYCDGHVARKTVQETLDRLEWGKKFYAITGLKLVQY
jgi:prepilin-type N-terminal cleavage/methylation domain-containing protein/prepilin-type processing-associated H-X9-DG protein